MLTGLEAAVCFHCRTVEQILLLKMTQVVVLLMDVVVRGIFGCGENTHTHINTGEVNCPGLLLISELMNQRRDRAPPPGRLTTVHHSLCYCAD